jgi:hypothetical protein
LAPAAYVIDPESPNFDTGTLFVQISQNADANDILSIRNTGNGAGQIGVSGNLITYAGTEIATFTGGVGTGLLVTLNANANHEATQSLLRSIQYSNSSLTPSLLTRTVSFSMTDGDGGDSRNSRKTITMQPASPPPLLNSLKIASYDSLFERLGKEKEKQLALQVFHLLNSVIPQ